MCFLIRFLLLFFVIYLLLKGLANLLTFGSRYRKRNEYQQQQQQYNSQKNKQPETQEDRIIEYQKKKFESSEIEDADFVEIKDKE